MKQTIIIFTGKVAYDIYGSYEDCSPGLYIDTDTVESIFSKFEGKNIKITIEELKEV